MGGVEWHTFCDFVMQIGRNVCGLILIIDEPLLLNRTVIMDFFSPSRAG